jgi:hypothetical protein
MDASLAQSTTLAKSYIFCTHQNPDTDAYACVWAMVRFVIEEDADFKIVTTDERLTADETGDAEVFYLDCCGGDFDQHGKELERSSSFELVCARYGLLDDPGIEVILEMTKASDNDERLSPDSLHYALSGLRRMYTDKATKETDWAACFQTAMMLLNSLYEQTLSRRKYADEYAALKEKLGDKLLITTDNNLLFVPLLGKGQLKEAARDDGADVVMVTRPLRGENANMFTVMIQVGRNVELNLDHVMSALRGAEARRRGIPTEQWATKDLWATGENKLFGGWYYHDSRRLIVCGTPKHELIEGEFTRLNPREVIEIVKTVLGQIFYKRH